MIVQQQLLEKLANEGDCVIVGRAADMILADRNPFSIFVCAEENAKIERCRARTTEEEKFSHKEILRKCREIDKRRRAYREMFTEHKWGEASGFTLCINTSGKEIKSLIPGLVTYINNWLSEE